MSIKTKLEFILFACLVIAGTGALVIVRPLTVLPITYAVISYAVAFFALFDALSTCISNSVAEVFNMNHIILNTILIVVFFIMSFVGTWMELPNYLTIVTLVLGTMLSINFMSMTNNSRS